MKHVTVAAALVAVCMVAGYQATEAQRGMMAGDHAGMMASDHAAVEKTLTANENSINEAYAKRDVATLKTLIAADASAIDPGGLMTAADLYKQLPTMDLKLTEQHASNFKYAWVNANTVVVTYTWTGKGVAMGQAVQSPVYASTVWTNRAGKWMAVFHQETPAASMATMKK